MKSPSRHHEPELTLASVRILLSLVVAAIIASPIPGAATLSPRAASIIIPGYALGSVTLGMPAAEANAAAAQFTRATGRVIDLLFRNGVVMAAGTAGGTRIELQLPNDSESFLPRDAIGGQSTLEINGSPDALVNAFGAPRVVREGRDKLALIFAAGLIAQVEPSRVRGVSITYVAIQAARTMSVPAIGHFVKPSAGLVETSIVPTAIVPGRSFGPVTLGMPAIEARAAASRFEQETGCNIDLLVARGVVIAAGSRWGGCLELQLPREFAARVGIGGHPLALIRAFGTPLILRHSLDRAALIFADGLVAHVGIMRVRGGIVTYLAIQPPGWSSAPPIGHFIDRQEAHGGEAVKEAKR